MIGVRKTFGATCALKDVSLAVAPGEVHALIGENGAGKSTLMKILSGACAPDAGVLELDGRPFKPANPLHARQCGIGMIYQELNLAPHLSVEENIVLGAEPHCWGWLNRARRRDLARGVLAELHHEAIPLDAPVHTRTIAEKQIIEIARALLGDPKVLIMDEPTSSLTQVDTKNLFAVIRRLRERGVSIIYISHFLEECQAIADRFTVLRDGETVGGGDLSTARLTDLIHLMVGREIKDIYPRVPHSIRQPLLEVRGLAGAAKPTSVSFQLHAGEILGLAGLVGAGRTETVRALFGLDRLAAGQVLVMQREATRSTPGDRLRQGMGLLSEDRKEEGLLLNRSLADNLTLTNLRPYGRLGCVNGQRQRRATRDWLQRLDVRFRDTAQTVGELSGGNQQKIAIGRLLHHDARILLLDEPTRGIDVASKVKIYELIGQLATEGKAVLFISSYLPELLGVCDTIGVMCRGVLSEVRPATAWTEHAIISAAIGQTNA